MNYNEKVVLITGGAGHIGRAFAKTFLTKGSKVCIADLNEENGKKVLQELQSQFDEDRICFVKCDVTSDNSFNESFDICKKQFGDVNILVNNAGTPNEEDWKLNMNVNLGGCLRGTEMGLQRMSKQKGGKGGNIINIASLAGLKTFVVGPFYAATKASIIHYTRSVGHPFHSLETGVQVQSLCPSTVITPFWRGLISTPYSPHTQAFVKAIEAKNQLPPALQVEEVSEALIKLLEEGKPGAVLIVKPNDELCYVETAIPSD